MYQDNRRFNRSTSNFHASSCKFLRDGYPAKSVLLNVLLLGSQSVGISG